MSINPAAIYEVFEPARAKAILDRVEFVFMPKHGSWLSTAEIEFYVPERQASKQHTANKQTLVERIAQWQKKPKEGKG